MSKQRARRRAARQAEIARNRAARQRRLRRHATMARLRPRLPRRRRVARTWSRRTRAQRAMVLILAGAVIVLTFLLTDSWGMRLAVLGLLAIAVPALTTLALGRSRG